MKRACSLCLFSLALMIPLAVRAQDRGDISVFGGYLQAWNADANQGWNASVSGTIINHLALVADFSGLYGSSKYTDSYFKSEDKYRHYKILFGPRYVHTIGKRWTPFAHCLVGLEKAGSKGWYTSETTSGSYGPYAGNAFAVAVGGGIDLGVNNRFSVRALQFDGVGLMDSGFWGYYVRASFGAVLHLSKASE